MYIVGHTLLWLAQLADFMKKTKDSATMSNYIKNHITTVVSRYKDKIDSWDVVNEALNEDGTLRKLLFLNVMSNNYIENAFKWAEKADPNVILVYNDYNMCIPKKEIEPLR